jgi:hypothetical protein
MAKRKPRFYGEPISAVPAAPEVRPYKVTNGTKITRKDQAHDGERRRLFLRGVIKQAMREGYGVIGAGKLVVIANRAFEETGTI